MNPIREETSDRTREVETTPKTETTIFAKHDEREFILA